MIPFKFSQYIQLKNPKEGSWGYLIKGYEIINNKIYLISGDANIKHDIDDIKESYKKYILEKINNQKI
jgi:hypothetical protein